MPYSASRKSREKRLRAYYRKKVWTTGIVMLIVGLIVGFIACACLVKTNDNIADLLGVGAQPAISEPLATATPMPVLTEAPTEVPTAVPTEVPTEVPTAEPTAVVTAEPVVEIVNIVEATAEPTAEPTEVPTEVPTAVPTEVPTEAPTAVPTEVPTEAPTAVPTAEPTAVPTEAPRMEPVIVPYGEACVIKTEINADGSARQQAGADAFETLNLTLQVKAYKDQAYYVKHYANSYILQGNEAAVEFDITLNNYTGSTEIIPQNFLKVSLVGANESITSQGYQLIDAEIEGKPGIVIANNVPSTVYKRYPYSVEQGDMQYMVVNSYVDGVEYTHWFEIIAPEPTAEELEASALTIGSSGEEVKRLQQKLIELKLLSGTPDGKFGSYTAEAVKIMQGRYGMEKTGKADAKFLERLYQ